ncbi:hypothetical protein [Flavobacterium selenitireducens]|uniref:hypothetical protein n=1 Tax=Flavobacterium selenitireducens TaxID=2722704 RepID=UPI00168B8B28|nr:hypothetical protein [Flavobacterium selenitireducens]MBD3582736.1 hypothetical protein [Flavobacterium selenitireducens]
MQRTIAQKMGAKTGMRAYFYKSDSIEENFGLPTMEIRRRLTGKFNFIHAFVITQSEFRKIFPKLRSHLEPSGTIWVSWPKSGRLKTNLTLPRIIEIGYTFAMVESKTISINETWSAIKFTFPKPGKTYENSFGKLPDDYS